MGVRDEALLADRYSLTEPLGSGGMGEVWRAWDTALGREVAVKLLSAPTGDPDAERRFTAEARVTARLNHPGIAALHDFGQSADGRPFLVMELVAGRSLARTPRYARVQVPWETCADLGAQAARALAAAHRAGIVHRDVKPANLLVTDDGLLKVVDFGIAELAGGEAAESGEPPLGTAAYTAPEVALRHPAGPASDGYALGCVLYELLAGKPPFSGTDAARLLYRQVHEAPARLTEIRPDAPPELLRLIHKLLAKNPADRPRDLADVAGRLQALATADADADCGAARPDEAVTEPLPPVPQDPGPLPD
ncbi:serine/threonine-protein kinase, partial [Streptomyces alkaliterrae]